MRIGINLIPLRPGRMGGAEIYLRDLLSELLARGGHQYVLVTAADNHATLPANSVACRKVLFARGGAIPPNPPAGDWARHWVVRGVRWLRGGGRRSWHLRQLIERERLDVWFCPFTNLEPRPCPVPSVITVFDLQHERFPQFFDSVELRHRRRFYPASCAGADHVIAISDATRRDVVHHYGVPPHRVTTVPLGTGPGFEWRDAASRVPEIRERYALPPRYVFYPAYTWRHKNHARLIDALARYRAASGDALALVLAGAERDGEGTLAAELDRNDLRDSVRMLGFVPRPDLPALYAGAACLVFPSLFEGFGIPLVEAMLAGCPIAASRATSIPEVVGDAAVLFDPEDADDIARAIADVVAHPATAAELVRRGRARAERFSVARTADLTLEIVDRVRRRDAVRVSLPPAAG
jgi:glycosyltransferase involved in cell wall biosynthesis